MPTSTYSVSLQAGGVSIQKSSVRSASQNIVHEETLPAAETGVLTTRSTDTTGTITMDSGSHTITTGATIDIFWTGGRRYGVTVGTVSGTSVPISGGSGDVLPIAATALNVDEQLVVNTMIDGDNAQTFAIVMEITGTSTDKGHAEMLDSGSAEVAEFDLAANTPTHIYDLGGGVANPITGNVVETLNLSNGSPTSEATFKVISLQDGSP